MRAYDGAVDEEEIPFFYVNAVQVATSPFDVTFDFGFKRPEDNRPGSTDYKKLVRVTMSPQHAKTLFKILNDQLTAYETRLGDIPSPEFKRGRPDL